MRVSSVKLSDLERAKEMADAYRLVNAACDDLIGAYRKDNLGKDITLTVRVFMPDKDDAFIDMPVSDVERFLSDAPRRTQSAARCHRRQRLRLREI